MIPEPKELTKREQVFCDLVKAMRVVEGFGPHDIVVRLYGHEYEIDRVENTEDNDVRIVLRSDVARVVDGSVQPMHYGVVATCRGEAACRPLRAGAARVIHYHGTPVSGSRTDVVRFLAGRHALIPFRRPEDLGAALEVCQSFVLDNSAFSHWRAGDGDIDVGAYHAWVTSLSHHPALDWCLIPDKIDGTEEENVDLVAYWLRIGSRARSVPVWHMHESLEWLDYLCRMFHCVALGSSGQWSTPGTEAWWQRMTQAMRVACDETGRPRTKLHGLRMLDPEIFTRLPLTSADSTNAAVNAGSTRRFGQYVPPTAAQRADVIASRIEAANSPGLWHCPGEQAAFDLTGTKIGV